MSASPAVAVSPSRFRQFVHRKQKIEFSWESRTAAAEARELFALVLRGRCTIDEVREVIEVPPETEAALRAYGQYYPVEACRIEGVLEFRKRVAQEFERIALCGL